MTAATREELAVIRDLDGEFAAAQYAAFLDIEQHSLSDFARRDPFSGVHR